ncbi:hypothetical protein [Mesorhizobium sp. WSM3224]|uniref:hypothetical protein n=1 Tax=Mesorhizobium sp. WSM3224 TaxID=1040986 RepID=UPI0003F97B9C|nr:hypothetical protein [Mesorhizobium sp. WSM3224]
MNGIYGPALIHEAAALAKAIIATVEKLNEITGDVRNFLNSAGSVDPGFTNNYVSPN